MTFYLLCKSEEHIRIIISSHLEVFLGKVALKICIKFTGKHSCRNVISTKWKTYYFKISYSKYLVFCSKSKALDPSTRYFDWNTRLFIWNTRYFENMWQSYSIFRMKYFNDEGCLFHYWHIKLFYCPNAQMKILIS